MVEASWPAPSNWNDRLPSGPPVVAARSRAKGPARRVTPPATVPPAPAQILTPDRLLPYDPGNCPRQCRRGRCRGDGREEDRPLRSHSPAFVCAALGVDHVRRENVSEGDDLPHDRP